MLESNTWSHIKRTKSSSFRASFAFNTDKPFPFSHSSFSTKSIFTPKRFCFASTYFTTSSLLCPTTITKSCIPLSFAERIVLSMRESPSRGIRGFGFAFNLLFPYDSLSPLPAANITAFIEIMRYKTQRGKKWMWGFSL